MMITPNKLLIVVVAYCPEEDILANCQISESQYLIIDNSPIADKALEKNCSLRANCHYMAMHGNKGIAKAFNIGCEYAIAHGFSWAVTMDQDSKMRLDILQKMLTFANQFSLLDKTAIISPRYVFPQGHKNKVKDEAAEYQEGIESMSSGNLVNLAVFKILGGFDNDLFIDMVDTDYYCKAMGHGYKVIMLNGVEMPHKLGNIEVKKLFGKTFSVLNHNPLRKYYQIRNGLLMIKRYNNLLKNDIKIVKKFLLHMVIKTILFEKNKVEKLKYILQGMIDFFKGRVGKYEDIRGLSGK